MIIRTGKKMGKKNTSQITIGQYNITRVEEILPMIPLEILLPRLDLEIAKKQFSWMVPNYFDPNTGLSPLSIHSWLLKTPHHNILIDACAGNHKTRTREEQADFANLETNYLENLSSAGITPSEIDFVLCTHLHVDHVGWNTKLENGKWVPTFPNAKYLFSEIDYNYWNTANRAGADPHPNDGPFDDSVLPIIEAGQGLLVKDIHEIEQNIIVKPNPGHSPGHVTLHIGDGDNQGVFSGDIMHHPLQVYQPDWSSCFCELPEMARQTRIKLLEQCADEPIIVMPAHFASPHGGRILNTSDGFALEWIEN